MQGSLPPFQIAVTAHGVLSEAEMDDLIAAHAPSLTQSKLGTGQQSAAAIRRSHVAFLDRRGEHAWLYRRIFEAAVELNRRFFCVDISGLESDIQIARYDSSDQGFYTWHTDFADLAPRRKISISIQLSDPADYEGGDLELFFSTEPCAMERTRGACIAFPSFALHRVTPVTRGTRWSLVAWISGSRWR